ncbi:MAG: hypothetical protein AB7V27_11935, partial [Candidatus Binatia bacterium]
DTQMAQDGQLPVYRALPHTVGDAPLDVLGNHDRGNASDIDRAELRRLPVDVPKGAPVHIYTGDGTTGLAAECSSAAIPLSLSQSRRPSQQRNAKTR